MANPKAHTLTDLFLPDGFGAFGFGSGGFGGTFELVNPQWNTNSGIFGIDPVTGLPSITATATPSYMGASGIDISYDTFFAKVTPAPTGNGSMQTALIVKQDANNYAEVSVGPNGVFNFYVANNSVITLSSTALPVYNSTNHAFWRIRNDGVLFHLDTAPDGVTWTELGNVPYSWNATNVTVMFFVGFNGSEQPGQLAYVTNVNHSNVNVPGSATVRETAAVHGNASITSPVTGSGRVNGKFGINANFQATLGIPQGGLTDFTANSVPQLMDPMISSTWGFTQANTNGGSTVTEANWGSGYYASTVPQQYRDGSYWPPAAYTTMAPDISAEDNAPNLLTSLQSEYTKGLANRLSLTPFIYLNGNPYAPGPGITTCYRTTSKSLTGQYSYQINSSNSPTNDGASALVYYPWPTSISLTKVNPVFASYESLYGSVYLSTTRANTTWYASFIFYDANFNVLSASTVENPVALGQINTHPGGGAWQVGNVSIINGSYPTGTTWVGIVPVVRNPSSLVETVYASNHSIVGASIWVTDTNTNYVNPNTMNVNIQADRVNYVLNGGFNSNVNFWAQVNNNTTGSPSPATLSWDGTTGFNSLGSAKMTFVSPSGSWSGNSNTTLGMGSPYVYQGGNPPIIQGLVPGNTYTLSAWVKQGPNCPDVLMQVADHNFGAGSEFGISVNASKSTQTIVNGWTQVFYTWTIPFQGLPDWALYFYVRYNDYVAAGENFSFWVDGILLEESASVGSFFDGNTATNDYMWESGGTANASRSYYYRNYTNKVNRLNAALPSVMPVGSSFNLEFAQPITTT